MLLVQTPVIPYVWLGLAGAALLAEMFSGTLYFLVLAVAAMAGAFGELQGASLLIQVIYFLLIAVMLFFVLLYRDRVLRPKQRPLNPADNLDAGEREASIARSEGEKQAAINRAQGEAAAILSIAEANAKAVRQIGEATQAEGGMNAVNLKVAEQYVAAFQNMAKNSNTLVVPANMGDLSTLITSSMKIASAATHSSAKS